MGHKTTSDAALSVVNNNVMKKQKAMDMKYHWLQCRESQGQFCHYWASGKTNNGGYVTKHHAPTHHQATRPIFLTPIKNSTRTTRMSHKSAMRFFFWKKDSR
jgi:hypothetical protein